MKTPLNPLELAGIVLVIIGVVWGLVFGIGIGLVFCLAGLGMRVGSK